MQKFAEKKNAFTHIVPYNSLTYKNQCCFMQILNIGVMVSDVYWVFCVRLWIIIIFLYSKNVRFCSYRTHILELIRDFC